MKVIAVCRRGKKGIRKEVVAEGVLRVYYGLVEAGDSIRVT